MTGFYGYGTWAAKYWFVGLEEGGGKTCDEVSARLRAWDQRGRPEIVDLRGFHRDAGLHGWFDSNSSAQSTWGPLIRAVLVAKGREPNNQLILDYQRSRFGAGDGETAAIEALPLPSPGRKVWNYDRWSGLPLLRERIAYERAYTQPRSDRIVDLITLHEPEVVVFYGHRFKWSRRFCLEPAERYRTTVGRWHDTLMIATDHPGARTNDAPARFSAIGDYIAQNTPRNQPETS